MEGAEDGIATATGMAAVFSSFMTFVSAGDHIVSASAVFGSTHAILTKYLPKWGVEYSYFDMNKPETIEGLIKKNTKLLYVETPSNPGLDIIDLKYVADICKKHNILFIVDNCFANPCCSAADTVWLQILYCILQPSSWMDKAGYWVE